MTNVSKIGYSDNQNPYLKSNTAKNIGGIAGVGYGAYKFDKHIRPDAYLTPGTKTLKPRFMAGIRGFITEAKNYVVTGNVWSEKFKNLINAFKNTKAEKLVEKLTKTKAGRAAYVATPFVIGAVGIYAAGRLVGKAVDLFVNKHRAKKADKLAEATK